MATANGVLSPVCVPAIVLTGAASPNAPSAYSVTAPMPGPSLATNTCPVARSSATPIGALRPVWLPLSVRSGSVFPVAPKANSATESPPLLATNVGGESTSGADCVEAGPAPTALAAVNVKVYVWPLVRPLMVSGAPGPLTVWPPPEGSVRSIAVAV